MHRHGNCGYKQTYALSQQALGLQNHSAAAALSAGLLGDGTGGSIPAQASKNCRILGTPDVSLTIVGYAFRFDEDRRSLCFSGQGSH